MNLELLGQYEIPYLHPLAVHFPLVLLLVGAGVAVLYAVLGRPLWRQMALAVFALGAASSYAAHETGETLEHAVEGSPVVEAVLHDHEEAAEWTMWLALATTIGFGAVTLGLRRRATHEAVLDSREPLLWRLVLLVPALTAALLVAYTGHLGGIMVWGVPVG